MPSVTVENYLKQVCVELTKLPAGSLVAMGRLAEAVGVTPGTATTMVKSLAEAGLVHYEPRGGVDLTPAGRRLAQHVLRRHRLVELFLVEVLKMDWAEVHDEAEELEHTISDKVLERIDALLGHPETDPHGSPIPRGGRALPRESLPTLNTCLSGVPLVIARITDHDADFLRFAEAHGLTPGATVTLVRREAHADAVSLRPAGRKTVTLGTAAAERVLLHRPAAGGAGRAG